MSTRNLIKSTLAILLIILAPLNISKLSFLFNNDQVIFLNIGQGDSTLICNKFRKCGLIDTGKQNAVINKIKIYSSAPLEFLILTHPDLDHVGKTTDIIKNIGVKRIFVNQSSKAQEIINSILKLGVSAFELKSENDFIFDKYTFSIFWPLPDTALNQLDSNDGSISIILSNNSNTFYLAGDLGTSFEQEVQKTNQFTDITIAKLSHHGSKNSSSKDFLEQINPDLGIFSVGKNSYGHPSNRVIDDLNIIKIPFLRTDLDGDIQIKILNENLEIITEKSKKSYIILN